MVEHILRFARWINLVAAIMAAAIIGAMFLLIIYEILLRAFFDSSTYILDEMVGYGVAISTFLGLGYALQTGSLIRVSLITGMIKNNFLRRSFELISIALVVVINCLVLEGFWKSITRNFNRNAVSETVAQVPLWIPEGLVFIGLLIFTVQLIVYGLIVITQRPLIGGQE